MKKLALTFGLLFVLGLTMAQPPEYEIFINQADSLYNAKNYLAAAQTYSKAFQTFGWKGYTDHRYNAGCSWALANNADSAFFQLFRIAEKANYKEYRHITSDTDLTSLHGDSRWAKLIDLVKQNKEKAEANLDKPLAAQLDSILHDDQYYRQQIQEVEKKYGAKSKEMNDLWQTISTIDSINLVKVINILDTRGWLGPEVVGEDGSSALFLVIQHADIQTQEKYLPMMREAVKNGKARGSSLALLEDRVALRQGKKQIYGSQIGRDPETMIFYVSPMIDPDNVDQRRAEVGLQPLADYVRRWDIVWDVEQYKKDLPRLEKLEGKK